MLAADPGRAVGDLKHRLADVERNITACAALYADTRNGNTWGLAHTLKMINESVRLARAYRDRLATTARLGGPATAGDAAGGLAGPQASTASEEVHAAMLAAGGQRFIDELRAMLAPAAARLRADLDQVEADIGHMDRQFAEGNRLFAPNTVSPHDGAFDRYAALIARRQELAGHLASIEQDAALGRGVQADLTAKAIEAAGGKEAVAKGVRDSWSMAGRFLESHPGHPAAVAAGKAVEAIGADLAKLGGPDAKGSVADQLRADREKAAGHARAKLGAVEAEVTDRIAGLVDDAAGGDEPARMEIERAARSEPRAFPPGFVDAICDAQFERSQMGALVHSMLAAASTTKPR